MKALGLRRLRALLPAACLMFPLTVWIPARAQAPVVSWVELGPGGAPIVRIVASGACPSILLTTGESRTAVRVRASADFPVQVCELSVAGTPSATVSGARLPFPARPPHRIVVVGDTGCRVDEQGTTVRAQACHDAQEWSWAVTAASAAAWRPDMVIHVGDLLYREVECPTGNAGCLGDPWGYRWATLNADFFAPAAPLLSAAPWVFVRGNHENCARDGDAWFRFFDPHPVPPKCLDYTDPYAVPLGDLQLLVLDSAGADDARVDPQHIAPYAAQFEALRRSAGANAWLVTHIPMWGVRHAGEDAGQERLSFDNPLLRAAAGTGLPPGVTLVLAGHIHLFELLSFVQPHAAQIVVGNGGTLLGPSVTTPLQGLSVAGARVTAGRILHQWGYLTLEGSGSNWTATLRDTAGRPTLACVVRGSVITCPP